MSTLFSVLLFLEETVTTVTENPNLLVPIAAALAVFTGVGAGVSIGLATGKAVEAVARQPEASGKIQSLFMLGLAFAETTAIYGTFVAIILLFVYNT